MIPKSVSVSTLILALGAALAWPVWAVEPGGSIQIKKVERCVTFTKDGTTRITCEQDFTGCYQRMREAMKAVDRQIQRRMEMKLGTDPSRMFLPMPQAVWDLWMDTIRDCVEDGK